MISLGPKDVGFTYNEAFKLLHNFCESPSFLVLLTFHRKPRLPGSFGCKIDYQDKFKGTGPWNRNFVLLVGRISARNECIGLMCI